MKIKTKNEVESAMDAAYIKAGTNAYFSNGFRMGAEWMEQQLEPMITEMGMDALKSKWVHVEDSLPVHPDFESVRVMTDGYDDWYVADFFEGEFYSRQDSDENGDSIKITDHITHWHYLQKLPK